MSSKFALVIANTEYHDQSLAKLTAPGRDAEEFARVLQGSDLAAFDEVQVLLNKGDEETRRAIARFFVNRRPDDLLLLYFSGHGVRNELGQLYLAASDTDMDILEATGVPTEFVTRSMNRSRSQRQVLILDCCNSGAFDKGAKATDKMGMEVAFGGGFGRVVLTATDAVQFAWEGDRVIGDTQNSVFTHFLIQGLKGNADRDGDGKISVDDLYDYAYEQVVKATPRQTPSKWGYKQQGEIFLRENLKPRETKPIPLPQDLLVTLSYPSYVARRAGIQELETFLSGANAGLKRSAEIKLREIAANDSSLDLQKLANDILQQHEIPVEEDQPSASPPIIPNLPKQTSHAPQPKLSSKRGTAPLPRKGRNTKPIYLALGGVVIVALMCLGIGVNYLIKNFPAFPAPSLTVTSKAEMKVRPTHTLEIPVVTYTPWPTNTLELPTFTSTPGIGSYIVSDGLVMLYVPAGKFTMGSDGSSSDKKPAHQVYLSSYYMDKYEVTNAAYKRCVTAGKCDPPKKVSSQTRTSYYGNSEFDYYPVIYLDWDMAKAYCEWRGDRLPTEAEWEKAARGTDERIYPWGNSIDCSYANYNDAAKTYCVGDTTRVGSYKSGKSPYGLYDMAGNVWEWVGDWYDNTYYQSSPASNPVGPDSGSRRVVRGGSWYHDESNALAYARGTLSPSTTFDRDGVRCVRSAK